MPILIVRKPAKAISPAPATVEPLEAPKAVSEPPSAPERIIPLCRYCSHPYLAGGCNFVEQKTCRNGMKGGKRRIASKVSLDA